MKRSTQIGLAAAGVLLVATAWSLTGDDSDESLVYNSLGECQSGGQLSLQQCETAFSEATAARLQDAPKYRSQGECEAQYGANGCSTANIGGAQFFIPALAGFMLARGLSGSAQAQPLLPPTTAACPPGSPQPECQQARSSSSGSSGGSGSPYGSSSRSRAYSTTSGRGLTAAFAGGARSASVRTSSVSSRGGFGSIARSFSSHSSS